MVVPHPAGEGLKLPAVSTFYTIDSANARVPDVREILLLLRTQREELIRLRDRMVELGEPETGAEADERSLGRTGEPDVATERPPARPAVVPAEEARLIRLRMQGIIDQMQASVARLDRWSITLRDIDTGLIDFPALASGRQIWLCWRLGEADIDWWHGVDEGFAGRRRLADLV
jgi:hypothetical protein